MRVAAQLVTNNEHRLQPVLIKRLRMYIATPVSSCPMCSAESCNPLASDKEDRARKAMLALAELRTPLWLPADSMAGAYNGLDTRLAHAQSLTARLSVVSAMSCTEINKARTHKPSSMQAE